MFISTDKNASVDSAGQMFFFALTSISYHGGKGAEKAGQFCSILLLSAAHLAIEETPL